MSVLNTQPPILNEPPEFGFIEPAASSRLGSESAGRKFWPRIPEFEVIDPGQASMLLRARELERTRNNSKPLGRRPAQIVASAWKQITKFREEQVLRRREQTKFRIKQQASQIEGKREAPDSVLSAPRSGSGIRRVWHSIERLVQTHQARKRLRLCETISLGEKRFIAVVQVDGKQLLVGGATNGLSVLANLESSSTFSNMLQRRLEEGTRA